MNIVISANGGEKTEPVGAAKISTDLSPIERRVGVARTVAKWKNTTCKTDNIKRQQQQRVACL